MAQIEEIEGIGPAHGAKLAAAGVTTTDKLLEMGGSAAERRALAAQTGIDADRLLEWVNHADLMRINGVGVEYADLLEAAGVDTTAELAQRNPATLAAKLAEVNAAKNLTNRLPSEGQVETFIAEAKNLPRMVTH